jgi:hypothetical protein
MPTAVARKLQEIQSGGMKAVDVAQLLGTRPETVSRWNNGKTQPQGDSLHRLLELEFIVQKLKDLYSPDEARLWVFSRHKAFNGERPADLIQQGRTQEVLRAIDQLIEGAYI